MVEKKTLSASVMVRPGWCAKCLSDQELLVVLARHVGASGPRSRACLPLALGSDKRPAPV